MESLAAGPKFLRTNVEMVISGTWAQGVLVLVLAHCWMNPGLGIAVCRALGGLRASICALVCEAESWAL